MEGRLSDLGPGVSPSVPGLPSLGGRAQAAMMPADWNVLWAISCPPCCGSPAHWARARPRPPSSLLPSPSLPLALSLSLHAGPRGGFGVKLSPSPPLSPPPTWLLFSPSPSTPTASFCQLHFTFSFIFNSLATLLPNHREGACITPTPGRVGFFFSKFSVCEGFFLSAGAGSVWHTPRSATWAPARVPGRRPASPPKSSLFIFSP